MRKEKAYANPYLVGMGIGLLLILTFYVTGRGLGAVGAFSRVVSGILDLLSPDHARANENYATYLGEGSPLRNWVVLEVLGICLGGFLSALLSGRFRFEVIRGPGISSVQRLLLAFAGGVLMSYGAKLSRGCTSGLALSGGAVLSPGAWLFMISVFVGGYAVAFLFRKVWN